MDKTFNVILTGQMLAGHTREAAAAALAKVAKLPEDRALGLLAGRETVVKRGLDGETAERFAAILRSAGVEVRKKEIPTATAPVPQVPPATAPVTAVTETINCPACGLEQPKRNLCQQCGADMPRWLAAREEAASARASRPLATAARAGAPAQSVEETPKYRRSRVLEILLLLFVTPLWGYLAMTDASRGRGIRIFGGISFAVFGTLLVLSTFDILSGDPEEQEVVDAFNYAVLVSERVGQYAIDKQEMPHQASAISLPGRRPRSVQTVAVGPDGVVRVTLSDTLKNSRGGAIVLTPLVKEGVIDWSCALQNVAATAVANACK